MDKEELLSSLDSGTPFNLQEEGELHPHGYYYLDLDFSDTEISNAEAIQISEAIASGFLPDRVEICLEGATLSQTAIDTVLNAFTSTTAPKNARVYFYEGTGVTPETIMTLSNAIASGTLAEGLSVCFHRGTALTNAAIEALGNAVISGKYPRNFSLSFDRVHGVESLSEGRFMEMLQGAEHLGPHASSLNISEDDLFDSEQQPLQDLIHTHSKKWPFYAEKDVKLAARILHQGQRDLASPVSMLPDDLLMLIASYTSEHNSPSYNTALASRFFGRPNTASQEKNDALRSCGEPYGNNTTFS